MPRPPRYPLIGVPQHVIQRGNNRQPTYGRACTSAGYYGASASRMRSRLRCRGGCSLRRWAGQKQRWNRKQKFQSDPYFALFDAYLISIKSSVSVRLLVDKYANTVRSAAQKFTLQHKIPVEVKSSSQIHDRLVFVDEDVCWVLGQSKGNGVREQFP